MNIRKVAAIAGIASVILFVCDFSVGFASSSGAPTAGAPAQSFHSFYVQHHRSVFAANAVDAICTAALLTFFGAVWTLLRTLNDGKLQKWAAESLWAAGAYVALTIASYAAVFFFAQPDLSANTTHVTWGMAQILDSAAYFPLAVLIIALSSDIRRAKIAPDWQSGWGIVAGVFLLVGDISFLITDPNLAELIQTFQASGSMALIVWIAALSIAFIRQPEQPSA